MTNINLDGYGEGENKAERFGNLLANTYPVDMEGDYVIPEGDLFGQDLYNLVVMYGIALEGLRTITEMGPNDIDDFPLFAKALLYTVSQHEGVISTVNSDAYSDGTATPERLGKFFEESHPTLPNGEYVIEEDDVFGQDLFSVIVQFRSTVSYLRMIAGLDKDDSRVGSFPAFAAGMLETVMQYEKPSAR